MTVIVTWLSLNFGLPAYYDHPSIEFISQKAIHSVRYGQDQTGRGSTIVALYDDSRKRILLPANWSATSVSDVSVLVHEMVHHLQRRADVKHRCAGDREGLAYAAQAKWLNQFGTDLDREFGLDAFTVKVMTLCPLP